jgi:glycosyltransferase involved in cell wall biosynthesis
MAQRVISIMGRILDQDDGLGVYGANLLTHMFQQDADSRYVVLLRTVRRERLFDEYPNVETYVLPTGIKMLWDQITVPLAARRFGADIIFNPKFSLPLLSRRAGVFVLQASDWYVNPENYEWWDNLYIRLMMPVYGRKAKQLLAISRAIADDLVKYAHVRPAKITVSYAAPSSHFRPDADESASATFASRYDLPKRFIFSVARAYHSGHRKQPPCAGGNLETLVRAYRRYRSLGGDLPLVIAGDRIEDYLLNKEFNQKDLEEIVFTGFIPHSEINVAYNLAELFVLLTLYESFAFPLVEAMASGCPAIVSATGACPAIAGDAAKLVDPRDPYANAQAMLDLCHSDEVRLRMKRKGLQRAAEFSWDETARRTLSAFERAAAERG